MSAVNARNFPPKKLYLYSFLHIFILVSVQSLLSDLNFEGIRFLSSETDCSMWRKWIVTCQARTETGIGRSGGLPGKRYDTACKYSWRGHHATWKMLKEVDETAVPQFLKNVARYNSFELRPCSARGLAFDGLGFISSRRQLRKRWQPVFSEKKSTDSYSIKFSTYVLKVSHRLHTRNF